MLNMKLEIYIPLKLEDIPKFESEIGFNIIESLTETFGGVTLIKASGTWINPKTNLMEYDNITIVRIYTSKGFWNYDKKAKDLFFEIIALLKTKLNQQYIAYTINDNMDFY